jgi:hypothetical protein
MIAIVSPPVSAEGEALAVFAAVAVILFCASLAGKLRGKRRKY